MSPPVRRTLSQLVPHFCMRHHTFQSSEDFLQAYDAHADELFRHCLLCIGDREKAKQLMHDTFAFAWKFIADGNYIDDMRMFLFRAVTGLLNAQPEFAVFDADALPESDKVLAVLRNVEPKQRFAFILRYVDEFSIPQTADILGESESQLLATLERGVHRITSLIEQNSHYHYV